MLDKVALTFESDAQILKCVMIQMKTVEPYSSVVPLVFPLIISNFFKDGHILISFPVLIPDNSSSKKGLSNNVPGMFPT